MIKKVKPTPNSNACNTKDEELLCVSHCCGGSIVVVPASEQVQYQRGQFIILGLGLLTGAMFLFVNAFYPTSIASGLVKPPETKQAFFQVPVHPVSAGSREEKALY